MILLRSYQLEDGSDVVDAWFEEQETSPRIRARFDSIMVHLRCQNREGWTRPYYDTLRSGVGEVRFRVQETNFRPLGFFGPDRNEFTFLFFATKNAAFHPPNAIEMAIERRELTRRKPNRSIVVRQRWNQ